MNNIGREVHTHSMSSVSGEESAAWSLAGYSDEMTGMLATGGLLIRPWSPVVRPRIEGENLVHDRLTSEEDAAYWTNELWEKRTSAPEGMLDAFIRIDEPRQVQQFADRWGAFYLCEHLLPRSHNSPIPLVRDGCSALGPSASAYYREPLDRWFFFARAARAILNVAAAFQAGQQPPPELLAVLDRWIAMGFLAGLDQPADFGDMPLPMRLQFAVNLWLAVGGVHPEISTEKDPPEIVFKVGTFGAIGMQIMQAVSRTQGIALCSSCGTPYPRHGRRVQAGRRNYCDKCGRPAALRDAQRNYAIRKKGGIDGTTQG